MSIVIPALNEAENLPELSRRIAAAMAGVEYEILIVDDNSRDHTPQVAAELAAQFPLRLIVREHPINGLSGAVLHGVAQTRGRRIVVMDADLQHPPEKVPELLAALDGGAEFALGSRYIPGGSTGENGAHSAKSIRGSPRCWHGPSPGKVNDPMSGFFALGSGNIRPRRTPHAARIQDRAGTDVQVPRDQRARGADPFCRAHCRRIEAQPQAAVPVSGASQPSVRLHLSASVADDQVRDRNGRGMGAGVGAVHDTDARRVRRIAGSDDRVFRRDCCNGDLPRAIRSHPARIPCSAASVDGFRHHLAGRVVHLCGSRDLYRLARFASALDRAVPFSLWGGSVRARMSCERNFCSTFAGCGAICGEKSSCSVPYCRNGTRSTASFLL